MRMTKIVIYDLRQNSDDKMCLQKAKKQPNFQILRLYHPEFYPDSIGVKIRCSFLNE